MSVLPHQSANYVTTFIVVPAFVIYGTSQGDICFIYLQTKKQLTDIHFKHHSSISQISSNDQGSAVVFVDEEDQGFLYDTFSQELLPIASFPPSRKIMWDQSYETVFHVFDGQDVHSYIVYLASIRGMQVVKLGDILIAEDGQTHITKKEEGCKLYSGLIPIMCQKGEIVCQSVKDSDFVNIPTDAFTGGLAEDLSNHHQKYITFSKCLVLNFLREAWLCANSIDSTTCWKALGNRALEIMDIRTAILAFQNLKEVAVVKRLEELQLIEEKNLLSGHLAILFGDYDLAESKFMMSSAPFEALQMRLNFGQWNEALTLAINCFPDQVKKISLALAHELEISGDFKMALDILERAMNYQCNNDIEDHQLISMIARICLRLGNKAKALALAEQSESPSLYSGLATILEEQNDYAVAAQFYELGGQIENAIKLRMRLMQLERVSQLIKTKKISMDEKFYNELASLCMKESGHYELAVEAFESAQNYKAAMHVCLTTLKSSTRALRIMKKHPCTAFALEASELCKNLQDFQSALEFLILGQRVEEAFKLAVSTDCIENFISLTGERMSSSIAGQVGKYYELTGNELMAAKFYSRSPQSMQTALDIYIRKHCYQEAMNVAEHSIELTNQFISLMKSNDSKTMEEKFSLYRFCEQMNLWDEAISAAESIMMKQLENSDYYHAYDIASKIIMKLRKGRTKIPSSFLSLFNVLHSYHLAKKKLTKADHKSAASLLARVSENIHWFPSRDHFNLYISTAVECSKCGFNVSV